MKVLVTGADGLLGQDLCPIFADDGFEVIKTNHATLDITSVECVNRVLTENMPDVVIHCAAYTAVDNAETDYESATRVNKHGTENVAAWCGAHDVTMIYISTDYVFDGTKDGKYVPTDPTNPINKYGLSKLYGEQAVTKFCKKYYIARTSWLYGVHGRNFVETMISQAATSSEVKVVDDQIGSPTWAVDLAKAILKLVKNDAPAGIYHLCGAGETSWYGFTKKIYELTKLHVNLKPCTSEQLVRAAKRPAHSVMDNGGALRSWEDALADYLKARALN